MLVIRLLCPQFTIFPNKLECSTRTEKLAMDEHFSLIRKFASFIKLAPGLNFGNLDRTSINLDRVRSGHTKCCSTKCRSAECRRATYPGQRMWTWSSSRCSERFRGCSRKCSRWYCRWDRSPSPTDKNEQNKLACLYHRKVFFRNSLKIEANGQIIWVGHTAFTSVGSSLAHKL